MWAKERVPQCFPYTGLNYIIIETQINPLLRKFGYVYSQSLSKRQSKADNVKQ